MSDRRDLDVAFETVLDASANRVRELIEQSEAVRIKIIVGL
jgi:hypothetical protein